MLNLYIYIFCNITTLNSVYLTKEFDQVKFAKSIEGMQKDGSLELHKDKDFQENPMERQDFSETVKTESIKVGIDTNINLYNTCFFAY